MKRLSKAKQEVRDYWNEYINGLQFIAGDKEIGSKEFFYEITSHRYRNYPYILKILDATDCKNKGLLEVGCGIGVDLVEWAKRGTKVSGIDITEEGINLAKKHFELHGLKADLRVGDAEDLGFKDNSFDIAYSFGVLHHTEDTQRGIDQIYRVLKDGGEAIVMLYHRYSWFTFLAALSRSNFEFQEKDAPIVKTYSLKEIKRMFSKFSKTTITLESFPTKTNREGLLTSLYNWLFVPFFSLLPKFIKSPTGFHIIIRAVK